MDKEYFQNVDPTDASFFDFPAFYNELEKKIRNDVVPEEDSASENDDSEYDDFIL